MAGTYHGDVRPRGVTVLASVWTAMAGLNLLLGLGATFGGSAVLSAFQDLAGTLTGGILAAVGWALVVLGLVQLGIAVGLWTLRPWARTAAVFFGVLGLFSFPVGTILAVVVLVYLFQPEVRAAFDEGPTTPTARPMRRRV